MDDLEKTTGFTEGELGVIETSSATETGKMMVSIREELDKATAVKTFQEKRYAYLRKTLATKMSDEGIEKFTVDGRGITTRVEVFASIPAAMREKAYAWLRRNKLGGMVKETVNTQTLKGWVNEQMREGHQIPEELFKVTLEDRARFY